MLLFGANRLTLKNILVNLIFGKLLHSINCTSTGQLELSQQDFLKKSFEINA